MNFRFSLMKMIRLGPSGRMNGNSSHDHLMMSYYYSIAYLGPSVTTYTYNNPGYRIYELDGLHTGTTFQLVNHHVYFFNLSSANAGNDTAWRYLYGAKVRNYRSCDPVYDITDIRSHMD